MTVVRLIVGSLLALMYAVNCFMSTLIVKTLFVRGASIALVCGTACTSHHDLHDQLKGIS